MHYKQNNKETKTYVQGLRSFGNTLPRNIKGILKRSGYNYSEIIGKWYNLVGEEISNCCFPKSIKMTRGNKHGTLVLSVKRGNEITVEYSKNQIINKINSHFGYKLINEIKLQTQNFEKKKIKKRKNLYKISNNFVEKIDKIKNKDIKKSLYQFLDAAKND